MLNLLDSLCNIDNGSAGAYVLAEASVSAFSSEASTLSSVDNDVLVFHFDGGFYLFDTSDSTLVKVEYSPPSPRLVCIETNPGPSKHTKIVKALPRKQRKTIKNHIRGGLAFNHAPTTAYIKSLIDPFEYSGCQLGWGTFVPTTVSRLYWKGTLQSSSAGNLSLIVQPCAYASLMYNNTSLSTACIASPATFQSSSDQAAITSSFTAGRVISVGLKATPLQALTSAPGAMYSGAMVLAYEDSAALTANDLIALPDTLQNTSIGGAIATGRPIDPRSFTFFDSVTDANGFYNDFFSGTDDTDVWPFSLPYIVFSGLNGGTTTTVAIEFVVNIESITAVKHSTTSIVAGTQGGLVSDAWASLESMWRAVSPALPPPSHIDSGNTQPGFVSSFLSSAGKTLGSGIAGYLGNRAVSSAVSYGGQRLLMG
jgi:hypothetical protein